MDSKISDWRPGPTVCRCCLSEGCYKDISTEYFWMGKTEVYADMLSETFNLSISYSQSGGPNSNSRLICEPCISRLRDASEFKRQVQECEKTFINHLDSGAVGEPSTASMEIEAPTLDVVKGVKLEEVKLEKQYSDDEFDCRDFGDEDDDDDLDDQPLTTFATKVPKKESVDLLDLLDNTQITVKRKSKTKDPEQSKKPKLVRKATATVKAKASVSAKKVEVKPVEKKKKDMTSNIRARRNAEIVLRYSTAYPFRMRTKFLMCVYCCDEFEDPQDFRDHVNGNHEDFTITTAFAHIGSSVEYLKVDCTELKCRLCSEPAASLHDMAKHIFDAHKSRSTKHLNLNYSIGMQPYKLQKDNWSCFLCNLKLPSLHNLCRHTSSHYRKFTCDTCGRQYLTIDALKYHIKCSHSGYFTCRKCWTDFPSSSKKKEHVKNSKNCWPNGCVYCGERFLTWEMKQKHLVEQHGCPENKYTCPDCSEVFRSRKPFYNHYKLVHSDDSFMCSCCGLKFVTKKVLEEHRLGHTGEKQHTCPICSKAFMRAKSLTQHMWIHSESKRFVCVLCEKQFAQKISLKTHMRSHHPDANCDI